MPQVSVVMPVYNGADFLSASIASIIGQTYSDFELIIIDDASTDRSAEVIAGFSDSRIIYRRLAENRGSAEATNAGHRLARGAYIAHIDQDDLAVPDRLERQVGYLDTHPAITVVGGMMKIFGDVDTVATAPLRDGAIKANLIAGAVNIFNPTVMLRRGFIEKHGLRFNPVLKGAADWGFYVEIMFAGGRFANIDAVLLRHRVHAGQQSATGGGPASEMSRVRARIIALFYPMLTEAECAALAPLLQWVGPPRLSQGQRDDGLAALEKAYVWQRQSAAGEDRAMLRRYLSACRQRWRGARV